MLTVCIISTACLLSYMLYKAFSHSIVLPYMPSILYALGGIHLLLYSFMLQSEKREWSAWAVSLLLAALVSFMMTSWLQARK